MNNAPLFCESCNRNLNLQLVYSSRQVAHLLNVPQKVIHRWMAEGRLQFRYRLLGASSVRRVVDYFQLWAYVTQYLPTPADLESPHLTKTQASIKRIIEWHRKGARTVVARAAKKRAEREAPQPGDLFPHVKPPFNPGV